VLYEMLTGRVPFDADTFPGLAVCVVAGKFYAPSRLCPELPPAIDALVARALHVEPSQRFATVHELYAGLARIVRAHTSEAVIKPEVMRALRSKAEPKRERIQDFKTRLLRRDGAGWRRVGFVLLLVCAVSTLSVALFRWANLETFDEPAEPEASADVAPEDVPAPEIVGAALGGASAADHLPPAAAPEPIIQQRTAAAVPSASTALGRATEGITPPSARPQRVRRKRIPTAPTPNAPAAPEPKSVPASSDETKYGF
jgi:serine/threonine-protein kinase